MNGAVIVQVRRTDLWKADEPRSDEWLFLPQQEVPDPLSFEQLIGSARPAALCKNCGRLYVQHDKSNNRLTEYVPFEG